MQLPDDTKEAMAKKIAHTMGTMLQQEYRVKVEDGKWWLFANGSPQRELRDDEVEWHVARRHRPFVPDGITTDDPRWFDDPQDSEQIPDTDSSELQPGGPLDDMHEPEGW